MIALIDGIIDSRFDSYLIINVNGVGYKIHATKSILSTAAIGKKIKVYTYTQVKEDALDLYGFSDPDDLRLFENLISVSGVGPKTAIGVFSVGNRNEIIKSIISGDVAFFTTVPRLGKKNAQKLIIELKNKLGSDIDFDINSVEDDALVEAVEALKGFGFTSGESYKALRSIKEEGLSTSEQIRKALKYLGK